MRRILAVALLSILILSGLSQVYSMSIRDRESEHYVQPETQTELGNALDTKVINYTSSGNYYPSNWSFIEYLRDNPNEYSKIWEPWITKAAIHAIATNKNGSLIALGGGYLYDNEIHIFAWNYEEETYDKVWDSGDGIIQGDVIALDIGDTDNNRLTEIVAGSSDGHIYVFEQRHVYDPITNTENMYDLVWKSPYFGPIWTVTIFDADLDYIPDIIAGSLDGTLLFLEYTSHSGYPFSDEHWIEYEIKWMYKFDSAIYSLVAGDINNNGLPEVVVGLRSGKIVVIENNGTVIPTNTTPIALPNDNEYRINWEYDYGTYFPILDMAVGDPDGDRADEVSIIEWGKEAYILEYESDYYLRKLYYPPKSFEMEDFPIDYWADWSIDAQNVYFYNGTHNLTEPIKNYIENTGIRFNNTAMGGPADGKYSMFLPNSTHEAYSVLDFGIQEEAVGDGTDAYDMYVKLMIISGFNYTPAPEAIRFYVSEDGNKYVELADYHTATYSSEGYVLVWFDIDPILKNNEWNRIRYLKIVVLPGHKYAVDAIRTMNIDKQLSDVTSTYFVSLDLSGEGEKDYLVFGTITGRIVLFAYNETTSLYDMVFDSQYEERFSLGENIWDIAKVMPYTRLPYWLLSEVHDLYLKHHVLNYNYLDIDGDGYEDLIFGTDEGVILYYRYNGTTYIRDTGGEYVLFNGSDGINLLSKKTLTVEMNDILLSSPGRELLVSYTTTGTTFKMYILKLRSSLSYPYSLEYAEDLAGCEVTGKLYAILNYGGIATPITMDSVDIDGDGDIDIILAIEDSLYVLWNLQDSADNPEFALDENYFEDVKDALGIKKPYMPQLVDFNGDGVWDLVVSYAEKNGTTYFENIGTNDKPIWVEKKQLFANSLGSTNPITNFAFNGFTMTLVHSEGSSNIIIANKRNTNKYYIFTGERSGIQTLALATYPFLSVVNFAPNTTNNYGYHIMEVWSNRRDLIGWTQSISFGDMDGDGKNEVIIGDYDNNVFVFEHITNNTYKISYKTSDLYYEIETNQTPYYAGELEGLQDTFKRRIWEHARFVIGDVDMDDDSKREFIVATGYQILVFEHQAYENYILEYRYSFLDHPLGDIILSETDGISAFAYAGDMDFDSYGELVVGIGPYLFIVEMTEEGLIETYSFLAGLFSEKMTDYINNKLYYKFDVVYLLPGTPATKYYDELTMGIEDYSTLQIRALLVDDIDENGEKEIFVGGLNTSPKCSSLRNGFLYALEHNLGTYYLKWIAPNNITYRNSIEVLRSADMDFDGLKEIIIGGTRGIDIFEYSSSQYLKYLSSISSSPDHPYIHGIPLFNQSSSLYDDYKFWDQDVVVLPDGRIYVFFVSQYNTSSQEAQIYYTFSKDQGASWYPIKPLTGLGDYGSLVNVWEDMPRVLYDDGLIVVAWYAKLDLGGGVYNYSVCTRAINATDGSLLPVNMIANFTSDFVRDISIWDYSYTWFSGWFFYTYIRGISYIGADGVIYLKTYRTLLGISSGVWVDHPFTSNISYVWNESVWHGFLKHDIAKIGQGDYALAFTSLYGDPLGISRIYVSLSDYKFANWSKPTIVYDGYYPQSYPDIEYSDDYGIVVSGMEESHFMGLKPFFASSQNGLSWSKARFVHNLHPNVVEKCKGSYVGYYVDVGGGEYILGKHEAYSFRFSIGDNGEVLYAFLVDLIYDPFVQSIPLYDIVVNYRQYGDWLRYDLGEINALAIGDSDGDSRLEIIANYFDDGIAVFEITSNTEDSREFAQKTILMVNSSVNDIVVFDSNGNGWFEILVACSHGNVFGFEFVYSDWVTHSLMYPNVEFIKKKLSTASITFYGAANVDSDSTIEYYFDTNQNFFYVYDYVADTVIWVGPFTDGIIEHVDTIADTGGAYDFVLGLSNGTIIIVDGETLSITARNNIYPGQITQIDVVNNTIFAINSSGYMYALDGALNIIWSYGADMGSIHSFCVLSDSSGIAAVSINNVSGHIKTVDYATKNIIWSANASSATLYSVDVNFDGFDDVIVSEDSSEYDLVAFNGRDGVIIRKLGYGFSSKFVEFHMGSIDGDKYPDVIGITENNIIAAISIKDFRVIWHSSLIPNSYVFLSDWNDDNCSEITFSFDGGSILANSYGSPILYYGYGTKTFMLSGDVDSDGDLEVFGFVEDGRFIVVEPSKLMVRSEGYAYYTAERMYRIKVFSDVAEGEIMGVDVDGSGVDDIVASNGTHIAIVYDGKSEYIVNRLPLKPRELLAGDLEKVGYESYIITYNDTHLCVLNEKALVVYLTDFEGYKIIRVLVGRFVDVYDSLIVVTEGKTYLVADLKLPIVVNSYGVNTYPVSGDFDGDGYDELAYKFLGMSTADINVVEIDGTLLWSATLSSSSTHRFTQDIFVLDYNDDGVDDIAFASDTGKINIYDGKNGAIIASIPTGIESFALDIQLDRIYGGGALAVKYAGYGFYIFNKTGDIAFEFKDASTAIYTPIDTGSLGVLYFTAFPGSLVGVGDEDNLFYVPLPKEAYTSAYLDLGYPAATIILSDGSILTVLLKYSSISPIRLALRETHSSHTIRIVYVLFGMITLVSTIITLPRLNESTRVSKRNTKKAYR